MANERAWVSEVETKMIDGDSRRIVMEEWLKTPDLEVKASQVDA